MLWLLLCHLAAFSSLLAGQESVQSAGCLEVALYCLYVVTDCGLVPGRKDNSAFLFLVPQRGHQLILLYKAADSSETFQMAWKFYLFDSWGVRQMGSPYDCTSLTSLGNQIKSNKPKIRRKIKNAEYTQEQFCK